MSTIRLKLLFLQLLVLISSPALFAQAPDRRAPLDIYGRVKELSVSPDEKIWLVTATGFTYFTPSFDSNWHTGVLHPEAGRKYSIYNPDFERIHFFNKDTAILTGLISTGKGSDHKNGVYRTPDGGNSWQLINFGGDTWIYTVCTHPDGNAWMGGQSGKIYYSTDFGQLWKEIRSPFNRKIQVNSIFMRTATNGIAAAVENDLFTTADNWQTWEKIPTPLDQEKFTSEYSHRESRILKIFIWKDFYIINQEGHFFYTNTTSTDWKPFGQQIVDVEPDPDGSALFAVTRSGKVLRFQTPEQYEWLNTVSLPNRLTDMKVMNHALYILTNENELLKVKRGEFKRTIPYTVEHPIETPRVIKAATHFQWGATGRHLYITDGKKGGWYREKALDFPISDISLLHDSAAILWDGKGHNYLYSLKYHNVSPFTPETPLQSFLSAPVRSFSIVAKSSGCFYQAQNSIRYSKVSDSLFRSGKYEQMENFDYKDSIVTISINGNELQHLLTAINLAPSAIPAISDFQITETDKLKYLSMADENIRGRKDRYLYNNRGISKSFFYSVPDLLNELRKEDIQTILTGRDIYWSTQQNEFEVMFINQQQDTLLLKQHYMLNPQPWHLPWEMVYKGIHFYVYDIGLSRFINACIPPRFFDKEVFDNSRFLMEAAFFLFDREKRKQEPREDLRDF
ncbi:MAG: hypothetical protein NTW29_06365 [Bacteroidetes bacterium]|nr:hypothetical protein [Bacteroidota bacterium]